MSDLIRHGFTRWTAALALLAIAALGATASHAQTTTYDPKKPKNGIRVYLSQACHNVAHESTCSSANVGCQGYEENAGSAAIATVAARHLRERGYAVMIGTGSREANIHDSNAFGALIHIPIHSNARPHVRCERGDPSRGGTWVMHHSGSSAGELARIMLAEVGPLSPGTDDKTEVRTNLAEIRDTNAHVAYLEAAFHTYDKDVRFLRKPAAWAWRIAQAVDRCRGFPRNGPAPTGKKECTW